ncbi:MAG: cell division protein FtsK, partial [Kutzneria sp.]|nr:cell division protein FtsK [Kutzneria sp.]
GELLTWLAKKGPAAGIVVVLATQRPDGTALPTSLRAVVGSRFALRVMDWRDSNIILGEQMNTRGYDSSKLLASHRGVGILRPGGDTDTGSEVVAMMVRTYYMPNPEWKILCQCGRALREAAGTLTGHAIGTDPAPVLDRAAVAKAINAGTTSVTEAGAEVGEPVELPEPLASVVDYLGEDLHAAHGRMFVPTAELVDALGVEPTVFGRQMAELGCRPTRERIPTSDGAVRQVRGYTVADIRAAVEAIGRAEAGHDAED